MIIETINKILQFCEFSAENLKCYQFFVFWNVFHKYRTLIEFKDFSEHQKWHNLK